MRKKKKTKKKKNIHTAHGHKNSERTHSNSFWKSPSVYLNELNAAWSISNLQENFKKATDGGREIKHNGKIYISSVVQFHSKFKVIL